MISENRIKAQQCRFALWREFWTKPVCGLRSDWLVLYRTLVTWHTVPQPWPLWGWTCKFWQMGDPCIQLEAHAHVHVWRWKPASWTFCRSAVPSLLLLFLPTWETPCPWSYIKIFSSLPQMFCVSTTFMCVAASSCMVQCMSTESNVTQL